MDGSHLSKEEKKDAITSLMPLTKKKEATESRAEHAHMAGASVENSKNNMQNPQQFQLKIFYYISH